MDEAISDGLPVDWTLSGGGEAPPDGLADAYRIIEAAAAFHRRGIAMGRDASPAAPDTPRGPSRPGETLAPGSLWGPLRIVGPVGFGSFGEVYRAYDPTLQHEVALKLRRGDPGVTDARDERYLDEARRLARVKHPNVLLVFGAARHAGRVGIWTEYIEGETLESALQVRGPLGPREAALVGADLCRALAAVHARSLVHGDVKTTNVMRARGGRIVLMDFGSVREAREETLEMALSSGQGTPLVMSPEQLGGARPTRASDIYGLGALLYRLVTGRYPVEATTIDELRDKHRRRAATPLTDLRPDLPPALVSVIERALAPVPGERYPSMGTMERALRGFIGGPPVPGRALATAALLVVLAAGGIALRDRVADLAAGAWARVTGRRDPVPTPVVVSEVAVCVTAGHQGNPMLVPDDHQGAIVVWEDRRAGASDLFAQRLDHQGLPRWAAGGVPVCTAAGDQTFGSRMVYGMPPATCAVPDGAGGAYIVWSDLRGADLDVFLTRISGDGACAAGWPRNGLKVCGARGDQLDPVMVADANGGVLVCWRDMREPARLFDIFAARITEEGRIAAGWRPDGVPVCTSDGDQQLPVLAGDGAGGAIVAWYDFRTDPNGDVVAQRLDGRGRVRWAGEGVVVGGGRAAQRGPMIVPDGGGGAVLGWREEPLGGGRGRIKVQRVDSLGATCWNAGGTTVADGRHEVGLPALASDGAGGVVVTWPQYGADPLGDIRAQRVDAGGRLRWGPRGRLVCDARGAQRSPFAAVDGAGGVYLGWADQRRAVSPTPVPGAEIFVQHLDSTGARLWKAQGVPACSAQGERLYPSLVACGRGCVLAAWVDRRSGSYSDIFAALLDQTATPPR